MTALLAFLRLAWPYLLCAAAAGYGVHKVDQIPYDRQATAFASYKAQVAEEGEKAQKAAADALQAQITTRLTIEANNGKVLQSLQSERDAALAARDFSDRLLSAAAKAKPSHPEVPATTGGPTPDATPQPSGGGQLADLLKSAAAETAQCFEHYAGLQVELAPQLKVPP